MKNSFDDDGQPKRTGTLLTATSHIITAVIGSGVLSLAWALAQLGWIAGPIALMAISIITLYSSSLLTDCYRSPDPVTGRRNYTYMEAVKANLGGIKYKLCGFAQYGFFVAASIAYTITASTSLAAIKRSNCFHKIGHNHPEKCHEKSYPFIIVFAVIEIILSQIPNFHKLSWLSIVAAIMSFAYSLIGLGLAAGKIAGGGNDVITTLTGVRVGVEVATNAQKIFRVFQAIGNIASAYFYSTVLIEIQDTLKSSPPENRVMKKASTIGVLITTVFYMLCGTIGYAAFGNNAPGNFLTGFGVYEPFWLIDIGNACIVLHLVGAYQVFCQPLFAYVEQWCSNSWPQNKLISKADADGVSTMFKLVWRTLFVIITSLVSMIFPFFNDMMGLIGAATFWPMGVYFPVEMYLVQSKTQRFSTKWIWLKLLSWACCLVSIVAGIGSIQGLISSLTKYEPFS
ncbi:hypothetical protein AQUCO_157400001v1 [Aquilegia coerulea]|uniref:Amino acid transporter transmembrane domain-containing protein n=1 Tax=Aquilegia coerulea TaxID=218851 RepID=A0A2G5C057_AQUCA|nr:hypothetical protein AQUCO_157400001v1 [Aquilegia coerulea]